MEVIDKQNVLLKKLLKFFEKKSNYNIIYSVLNKENGLENRISLRILEWFYSSYAKRNNTHYYIGKVKFNVYQSYKEQLRSFQKINFDPFRRKENEKDNSFIVAFSDKKIITTISQLNFFKWCIENKVLDYVKQNLKDIRDDMNNVINANKSLKKTIVKKPPKKHTGKTKEHKKIIERNVKKVIVEFQ